jgi:hypothetical protein
MDASVPQLESREGDLIDLARFVFDRWHEPGEVQLHSGTVSNMEPPDLELLLPYASKDTPAAFKLFHVMYELFMYGVKLHNDVLFDAPLPAWNDMLTTTLPFVTQRMEMAFGVTPHLTPADRDKFTLAPSRFHYIDNAVDVTACKLVDTTLMLEIRFTFGLPLGRRRR